MSVQFKVLSHAGLYIKSSKASIVIDPWLIGSCYWRSWWNYPEPKFCVEELNAVDAVVISHVHWDHWHGPTLKKFFKGKPIITSEEPSKRSVTDLQTIGFHKIKTLRHARSVNIGDIRVTFYNFGLFLTDSAIVIEIDGVTILNANDAKIAGAPLRQILSRHRNIDFALRSHSSANPRVCYEIEGGDAYEYDEREHYFRSFCLFMEAVNPRYAIPFASNHVHLHKDSLQYNTYITDPSELSLYKAENFENTSWKLQVLTPGAGWDSGVGFQEVDLSPFVNKASKIEAYRTKMEDKLNINDKRDSVLKVTPGVIEKFLLLIKSASFFLPKCTIRFLVVSPDPKNSISLLYSAGSIQVVEDLKEEPAPGVPVMVIPIKIFIDSVLKNMFHHAGISKRCRYKASNGSDMARLQKFMSRLETHELTGRLSLSYLSRVLLSYGGRYRELTTYAYAAYLRYFHKKQYFSIEEKILETTRG